VFFGTEPRLDHPRFTEKTSERVREAKADSKASLLSRMDGMGMCHEYCLHVLFPVGCAVVYVG